MDITLMSLMDVLRTDSYVAFLWCQIYLFKYGRNATVDSYIALLLNLIQN